MSADGYSRDEMTDDVQDWQSATPEQKLAAFDELMNCATADAYVRQDKDLITRLRRMRAERQAGEQG